MLVWALPGWMPILANSWLPNDESVDTWNSYDSGRTPFVVAFFTVSVIGWSLIEIWAFADGVTTLGALMVTPAIGPATVGLRGLELLIGRTCLSQ